MHVACCRQVSDFNLQQHNSNDTIFSAQQEAVRQSLHCSGYLLELQITSRVATSAFLSEFSLSVYVGRAAHIAESTTLKPLCLGAGLAGPHAEYDGIRSTTNKQPCKL